MSTMDVIKNVTVSWPSGVTTPRNLSGRNSAAKSKRHGVGERKIPNFDNSVSPDLSIGSPRMTKAQTYNNVSVSVQSNGPILRDVLEVLTCNSTEVQRKRAQSADRAKIMKKTSEKRGMPLPAAEVALRSSRRHRHPERLEANLPVKPIRLFSSAHSRRIRQTIEMIQEDLAKLTNKMPPKESRSDSIPSVTQSLPEYSPPKIVSPHANVYLYEYEGHGTESRQNLYSGSSSPGREYRTSKTLTPEDNDTIIEREKRRLDSISYDGITSNCRSSSQNETNQIDKLEHGQGLSSSDLISESPLGDINSDQEIMFESVTPELEVIINPPTPIGNDGGSRMHPVNHVSPPGTAGAPPVPPSSPESVQPPPATPVERALKHKSATYSYKRTQRKNRIESMAEARKIINQTKRESMRHLPVVRDTDIDLDFAMEQMKFNSMDAMHELYGNHEPYAHLHYKRSSKGKSSGAPVMAKGTSMKIVQHGYTNKSPRNVHFSESASKVERREKRNGSQLPKNIGIKASSINYVTTFNLNASAVDRIRQSNERKPAGSIQNKPGKDPSGKDGGSQNFEQVRSMRNELRHAKTGRSLSGHTERRSALWATNGEDEVMSQTGSDVIRIPSVNDDADYDEIDAVCAANKNNTKTVKLMLHTEGSMLGYSSGNGSNSPSPNPTSSTTPRPGILKSKNLPSGEI